jgi:hypothetical protein|nr:MAG TPA: hypothetical protein [Caudoviricetes sp.]
MEIEIIVREKVARLANKHDFAVCGNSDYKIKFDFDSEWDAYEVKTARFKYNGTYTDVVFNGCECPMPIITSAFRVEVGVYAGDLRTTSCAVLPLKKSILCGSETESKESQEIKDSINKILKEKIDSPQKAGIGEVLTVEEVDENGKPTKWKTAPAAAEQKQADWGQNDETAADFVRNRPCYTEWKAGTYFDATVDKETAIQDGVFFYRIDNNEINWDMFDKTDNQLFVKGRKYNIVFDGVTYTSTAEDDMIGNGHLYYEELEDNGMPFVVSAGNGVTLACKTAGEHSIKVTGEVPTYHELDKRYYNKSIEYDAGIMNESPSRISLSSYTQAMDIGRVQWDYTLMRPTEEEVKELGDELFNMYPVNLYVTGARNMILGVVPYGDSSLIVELPVNVGDTKIISITETPSVDVTYRDTNQYLIKIKETGANKPTLYVWFNTYDEKSGARSALVYYNNALYSMELNTNLKIKRIL